MLSKNYRAYYIFQFKLIVFSHLYLTLLYLIIKQKLLENFPRVGGDIYIPNLVI